MDGQLPHYLLFIRAMVECIMCPGGYLFVYLLITLLFRNLLYFVDTWGDRRIGG